MHNIKDLRNNLENFKKKLLDRNFEFQINLFKILETTFSKFLSKVLYKLSIISSGLISWERKSMGAALIPICLLNKAFPAKYASCIVLKSSSACAQARPDRKPIQHQF